MPKKVKEEKEKEKEDNLAEEEVQETLPDEIDEENEEDGKNKESEIKDDNEINEEIEGLEKELDKNLYVSEQKYYLNWLKREVKIKEDCEARKENISENVIENLQVQETNVQREDYITEMIDNIENIQKETSEQRIEAEESSMDFGNSDENEDSEEKNNSNIEEGISENINTNISESVDFNVDEWETAE